jgi:hypothetical protein
MKAINLPAAANAVFSNQSDSTMCLTNQREREIDRHLVLPQVRVKEGRVDG